MTIRTKPLACLALAALTLQGASAPAQSQAATTSAEKRVDVSLKYDASTPPVPVGINLPIPDPVVLSKSQKQKAHWYLSPKGIGKLTIEMKQQTPFKSPAYNAGDETVSDVPAAAAPDGDYAYKITVELKNGTKLTLDPIIKITP